MTSRRIVHVHTLDHDLVTLRCPDWCTGEMHRDGNYREDLTHTSPDAEFPVPTPDGPVVLLRLGIEEQPFTDRDPFMTVEVGGGWQPVDVAAVDQLAAALVAMAGELRAAARRMAATLAEDGETR